MRKETVIGIAGRRLPPLSAARRERLEARVPLLLLAAESNVSLTLLSQWERGLRQLTREQDERRVAALRRLR